MRPRLLVFSGVVAVCAGLAAAPTAIAAPGDITTVAGTGTAGFSGDDGPAISAELGSFPAGLAVDGSGNLYIADGSNNRVRRVSSSGMITTVAGTGAFGSSGDGGPATEAGLNSPQGVALDGSGSLHIAETGGARLRKVDGSGTITTTGVANFLAHPVGMSSDGSGNVYVADPPAQRVRKLDSSNTLTTVAGMGGDCGFSGDGGPATAATVCGPYGVAADDSGNLYVADYGNNRVRMVDDSGTITTVAGNGSAGFSGDGGPATSAALDHPFAVAVDDSGNLYIADYFNNRVRMVDASGTISTVAGTGTAGFSGDGGPATSAQLNSPFGLAVDGSGSLYISDGANNRVRKVEGPDITPPTTTITSGPSGTTNDSTPTFGFSAEAGSSFECKVDSGSYASCISPKTTANIADGSHTFYVRATDQAQNLGPEVSRSFTVDTVGPTATISGPSGTTNDPTPTFTFSSEPGASLECKVDSGSYAACGSPRTLAHLADGSHTFSVRATDPAGNLGPAASRSFTVDTAEVAVAGSTLTVTAATGANDNLRVTKPSASTLRVTDLASGPYTGSGVHTGAGCTRSGDYTANCSASGITLVRVLAADQADQVVNSTSIVGALNGGPANDVLQGGFVKDTLTGAAGTDVMRGMNGSDVLQARDLASDQAINCDGGGTPGAADKADLDLLPLDPNSRVSGCEAKTRH